MILKFLNPNSLASATSVSFQQRIQNTSAVARDEKILVIGNYQDGKAVLDNVITQFTNSDDVATVYGFGSPLHRMAMKLFPNDGNGSKVPTYFLPIDGNGTAQISTVNITGTPNNNFTGYLRFKELEFEAPADVVGKIATSYQLNPAKAPRKMEINIFNKVLIPFTILRNSIEAEILSNIKNSLDTYIEVPFVSTTSVVETKTTLSLTSKWKGETAKFDFDFVDGNNKVITVADYGILFTQAVTTEASGIIDIKDALDVITTEHQFTRIISQFNDTASLDLLKDKCLSFRDSLICQWILAYTGRTFKESELVPNTVDTQELITFGDSRRLDPVNVIIAGGYDNELRPLTYNLRDQLLKAGISNLEPIGYTINNATINSNQLSSIVQNVIGTGSFTLFQLKNSSNGVILTDILGVGCLAYVSELKINGVIVGL